MIGRFVFLACFWPVASLSLTLEMPGNASLTEEVVTSPDVYDMPTAPWTEDGMPILTGRGEVRQQSWRIEAAGLTTLQMLDPLRAQLEAEGFVVLFECHTDGCGGFDFRFATAVLPAPAMHVDLGDFRFLATEKPDPEGGAVLLSVLTSRSSAAGYVQLTRVGPPVGNGDRIAGAGAPPARGTVAAVSGDLAADLEAVGHVILADLAFETGSAQLGPGEFQSLVQLADFLRARPELTVALVGHTDAVGALDGNISLSRRRAGSVLERLATEYGIPRQQMEAQGMGYLAPIASNLTEEGRTANRRVEVIITSTR